MTRFNVNIEPNGTIRIQRANRDQFGQCVLSFRAPDERVPVVIRGGVYLVVDDVTERRCRQALDWAFHMYDV